MNVVLRLLIFAPVLVVSLARAQEPIRVRGTIERIEGPLFVLKTRYGAEVKLTLAENPECVAVVKSTVADIKPGMLVGTTGKLQPDGSRSVAELHVFSDVKGIIGEGNSAIVEQVRANGEEHEITTKENDLEKKIIISTKLPVTTFVEGARTELKLGVAVFVGDAKKQPEGLLQASHIVYGRDGLTPPL
jgi:hypothetical protein